MDLIKTWTESNSLNVDWIGERVFVLNDKVYLCILPKNGKLFNEEFEIILDESDAELHGEVDFFCFSFGTKVYYSSSDNPKCKLNILKHIGKANGLTGFPYLGIHGGYELCNGSRVYEDWCAKANFLSISTLAIAERHTLAGALKFQESCGKAKIKSIIGETVTVKGNEDKEYKVKLYVADETGWRNLLRIHKILNVENNSTNIDSSIFSKYSEGLYCVIQCDTFIDEHISFLSSFWSFKKIFFQLDPAQYKAAQRDTYILQCLKNYFNYKEQFPLALICDSYYLDKEDCKVKKILNFVGSNGFEYQSEDQYFKSFEDVCSQVLEMFTTKGDEFSFEVFQNAIAGAEEIAENCNYKIKLGEIHLPKYELNEEEAAQFTDSSELFWHLINKGLEEKVVNKGKDYETYMNRVAIEADVIIRGGFIDYFLILRDIINWCEVSGILVGTGRGSAGGSEIAYLLGITKIDAIEYDLVFERFLNSGRIGKQVQVEVIVIETEDEGEIEVDIDANVDAIRDGKKVTLKITDLGAEDEVIKIEPEKHRKIIK